MENPDGLTVEAPYFYGRPLQSQGKLHEAAKMQVARRLYHPFMNVVTGLMVVGTHRRY